MVGHLSADMIAILINGHEHMDALIQLFETVKFVSAPPFFWQVFGGRIILSAKLLDRRHTVWDGLVVVAGCFCKNQYSRLTRSFVTRNKKKTDHSRQGCDHEKRRHSSHYNRFIEKL